MINVKERSYNSVLSYEKEEHDGKLGRSNGRVARLEMCVPYDVRNWIIIKIDEIAPAADVGVTRILASRVVSDLISILQLSTVELFLAFLHEVDAGCYTSIIGKEIQLVFLRSGPVIK